MSLFVDDPNAKWDHIVVAGTLNLDYHFKCFKCGAEQRETGYIRLKNTEISGSMVDAAKYGATRLYQEHQCLRRMASGSRLLATISGINEGTVYMPGVCGTCGSNQPWGSQYSNSDLPVPAGTRHDIRILHLRKGITVAIGLALFAAFAAFYIPRYSPDFLVPLAVAVVDCTICGKICSSYTHEEQEMLSLIQLNANKDISPECLPVLEAPGTPDINIIRKWDNDSGLDD